MLRDMAGADHMVMGSDHPHLRRSIENAVSAIGGSSHPSVSGGLRLHSRASTLIRCDPDWRDSDFPVYTAVDTVPPAVGGLAVRRPVRGVAVRGAAAAVFVPLLIVGMSVPSAEAPPPTPAPGFSALVDTSEPRDVATVGELQGVRGSRSSSRAPSAPEASTIPPKVYVPNEMSNTVSVIDPQTFTVIATIKVGSHPQHVTPDWDLQRLYVNDTGLTEIDPRTGRVTRVVPVAMPYNLYFTPDGSRAIVVAEDLDRLDFYDRLSWTLVRSVRIPWKGIDHLDFSLDGSYLLATTEYTGRVLKVDTVTYTITGVLVVGGMPVDVRLSPDGSVFYVTNQGRHGVSVVDPIAMKEIAFIGTGRGAHGLQLTRDGRRLFVSNRLAGTISVVDLESRRVTANWLIGGSPDMLQLSPDGRQLWTGNRYSNSVTVVDTANGAVLAQILVERAPHGLTYFPQPGRFSIGHNGMYR